MRTQPKLIDTTNSNNEQTPEDVDARIPNPKHLDMAKVLLDFHRIAEVEAMPKRKLMDMTKWCIDLDRIIAEEAVKEQPNPVPWHHSGSVKKDATCWLHPRFMEEWDRKMARLNPRCLSEQAAKEKSRLQRSSRHKPAANIEDILLKNSGILQV